MAAIDQAMVSRILNSTTSATAFSPTLTTGFKVRLNSTLSTASAAGTEIANGGGYTTGGQTSTAPFATTSSGGSNVTLPHTAVLSWPNTSGSTWSIASLDLTDGAGVRTWFGPFTGQPISVASGNTFQIALDAVVVQLS